MVRHITRRLASILQQLIARTVCFLLVVLWRFLGILLRIGLSHLLHKTLQTDSFEKTIFLHLNFNGVKHLHIGRQWVIRIFFAKLLIPVSYTHLDVYKRQVYSNAAR